MVTTEPLANPRNKVDLKPALPARGPVPGQGEALSPTLEKATDVGSSVPDPLPVIRVPATWDEGERINEELAKHQVAVLADDREAARWLPFFQTWAERFNFEFKLNLPPPALTVESLHVSRLGHYRIGRNGFGLRDEIAINERYLLSGERQVWQTLGTLLHELLHSWQDRHGKPPGPGSRRSNYHNIAFRRKAAELGLIVDQQGVQEYAPPPTPFFTALEKYGVVPPTLPQLTPLEKKRGHSKLRLYECPCGFKIRVGNSRFPGARCLQCNELYQMKD